MLFFFSLVSPYSLSYLCSGLFHLFILFFANVDFLIGVFFFLRLHAVSETAKAIKMEGTDCNKQSDKRVRLDYSREAALQNNCRSFSSMFVVVMGFYLLLGQRLGEGLDLGDFVGTLPLRRADP